MPHFVIQLFFNLQVVKQTGSRSVQPFFRAQARYRERLTDTPRYGIIGRNSTHLVRSDFDVA